MGFVRRDPAGAAAFIACFGLILVVSPSDMVQDSWLTLVAGRLVSAGGIPHHNLLTVLAHSRTWIDQQWLAQLLFYRAYDLGGLRTVILLSALLSGAAWLGAIGFARRRGAAGVVLLLWAPATLFVSPWVLQARAQSFALPLFVAVAALVFADSRRRSGRVFAVVPLIAVWGNLHGTALLGAGVVALHAVITLVDDRMTHAPFGRSAARAVVLAGGSFLALAANPYGFGIASYYRMMTVNPPFASLVLEWRPSTPSAATAPFYALAAVAVVLAIRHRRRLTPTELAVGLALLAAAIDALRSIPWFALATLMLVPPLIKPLRLPSRRVTAPARVAVLIGAAVSLVAAVATFPSSVAAHQNEAWPARGAAALAHAVAKQPASAVLADDRHSDFVLWQEPTLAGKLLADVRFELLSRAQLVRLARFEHDPTPADALGADFVVIDPSTQSLRPWRAAGWKRLYVDSSIGVFERAG